MEIVDVTKDFVRTEMAFSAKWKNHHRNHHAKDWVNWQKNWFLERFDWKSIKLLNTFLKSKKFILDAGTGIGNSAKFLSSNLKADVFALDASNSVDLHMKNMVVCQTFISYKQIFVNCLLNENSLIIFILTKFYIIQKTLALHSNI